VYGLRRFLKWFFIKRTNFFEKRLNNLKEEKKIILEEVKEKETYKKAKEILERFGSSSNVGNVDVAITPPCTPMHNVTMGGAGQQQQSMLLNRTMPPQQNGMTLTHRNVNKNILQQLNNPNESMRVGGNLAPAAASESTSMQTPINSKANLNATAAMVVPPSTSQQGQQQQQQPPIPPSGTARTLLPRPIINPNRTFFDRILDFIIGEGPNNR
jgi:hypothetical protein